MSSTQPEFERIVEKISADVISNFRTFAIDDFRETKTLEELEQARIRHIGSNGKFTSIVKQLGTLQKEDRPAIGKILNQAKIEVEAVFEQKLQELQMQAMLPKHPTDFTLPGRRRALGKLHPLTQVTDDIVRAFRKIGFAVADGPEIEDEYHCFDALNTPADHPARDSQDTFYVATNAGSVPPSLGGEGRGEGGRPSLLRTHTSSVQIRVMEKQPPPVRIIVPGRVYRRDNADATAALEYAFLCY